MTLRAKREFKTIETNRLNDNECWKRLLQLLRRKMCMKNKFWHSFQGLTCVAFKDKNTNFSGLGLEMVCKEQQFC